MMRTGWWTMTAPLLAGVMMCSVGIARPQAAQESEPGGKGNLPAQARAYEEQQPGQQEAQPDRPKAEPGSKTEAARSTRQEPEADPVPIRVTAGQIAGEPASYYGRTVAVRAEVEDVAGPQAFLLDEDRVGAGPDVLVLTRALAGPVPEDELVTVTGTVHAFVEAEIRRDYDWGWWDAVDPEVLVAFRSRPVIMAESVRTEAGRELVRTESGTR